MVVSIFPVSIIFPLDFGTVLTGNFFVFYFIAYVYLKVVVHASFRSKFNINTDQ